MTEWMCWMESVFVGPFGTLIAVNTVGPFSGEPGIYEVGAQSN